MPNGKADANACGDDDDGDGVDVQKIVQHCHFQPEFLVYDDNNFNHHDDTVDDSENDQLEFNEQIIFLTFFKTKNEKLEKELI